MKPLILVLLVSIIVFSQCDSNLPIIGKKEKESMYAKVTQMCYFVRLLGGPSGYKVVDNNDGTVALVSYSSLGADFCPPPFGKTESILQIQYYIKKCIQGQVYRQAQNDCKGTGTAVNYYSAQKLQMCPTTSSCIDSASPAKSSCINDTITVIKWKMDNFLAGNEGINTVSSYFKSRTDEIPSSSTDYYWGTGGYSVTDISGNSNKNNYNYLSTFYVLCFQNQS
jgi:hypothetical protein